MVLRESLPTKSDRECDLHRSRPSLVLCDVTVDKTIRIWHTGQGTCTAVLSGHIGYVQCLVECPDGSIASGALDGTVRCWKKGGVCDAPLVAGHEVHCLIALPDGTLASGGGDDHSLVVW